MPNPDEVATVVVNNLQFNNWKTVWVQHRWAESFALFKFTTADVVEVPPNWELLQFKPRDYCAIYLGGWLTIDGVIKTRQTAYDAMNHEVMLEGVSLTWYAARASVLHPTGNFDDKTFEQVAREVIAPTGVGIKVIGKLDATPFARLSVEKGETIWDFLERIARVRGIILGSDHEGNFLLIGDHAFTPQDELIEGVNIKRMNAIIDIEDIYSKYIIDGQTAASDSQHGTDASEQEAEVGGTARFYSPLLTPAEQPVWGKAELQMRAQHEAVWHEGTIIQATVVVQGWMCPSGGPWRAGSNVLVKSPMAMLDMIMKIHIVTFTQDNQSGTQTTLDLVVPWLLKDQGRYMIGQRGVPQIPTTQTIPSQTPVEPQDSPLQLSAGFR